MLNDKERRVIHDSLASIAKTRVRLTQELSEHAIKSIKIREEERELGKSYDELAELLKVPTPAEV